MWTEPIAVLTWPGSTGHQVNYHENNTKYYHSGHAGPDHDFDMGNDTEQTKVKNEECYFDQGVADANEHRVCKRALRKVRLTFNQEDLRQKQHL